MTKHLLRTVVLLLFSLYAQAQCNPFITISKGGSSNHAFGIKADGTLFGWGFNFYGEVGNGSSTDVATPTQIGSDAWTIIATGQTHTLGIKADGSLYAWGLNGSGELGSGNTDWQKTPVSIGSDQWLAVAGGNYHSVGIQKDGTLWAWGSNLYSQVGNNGTANQLAPVKIDAGKWKAVATGYDHTLALKEDGTLWAWGRNDNGQLGDGTITLKSVPTQISTDTWIAISAGFGHSLAIKSDGKLYAWGMNEDGQLGNSSNAGILVPTQIGTDTWTSVSAGHKHSFALKSDQTFWAWGDNKYGKLGNGSTMDSNVPIQIGAARWKVISAAYDFGYGIQADGGFYTWGRAEGYRLGNNTTSPDLTTPTMLITAPDFPTLATTSTVTMTQGMNTMYNNSCSLGASVAQWGLSPITGTTTAKVWIESVQPGQFVKRHYEITPASNAEGATGHVTLYFTQQEFDDFNAVNTIKLPTNSSDANGKANLLIEKRGGQSSGGDVDATGMPETYSGSIGTIDPDDVNVLWNSTASRWEVTFGITGFSGFFVKTRNQPLPVTLTSFEAGKQENTVRLSWNTASEVNSERFEIQHSKDGLSWERIGSVATTGTKLTGERYFFDHYSPLTGENLYRLKMVDLDGSFAYSRIRSIFFMEMNVPAFYPNPVREKVEVKVSIEHLGTEVKLLSLAGKTLTQFKINKQSFFVDLSGYGPGVYFFQTHDGKSFRLLKH